MNRQSQIQLLKKIRMVRLYGILLLLIIFMLMGNGFFIENPSDTINVQSYGTKGDGINDDTNAIQKALNKAKTSTTPIKVIVPSGTYKLTETLRIYNNTHLVLLDNSTFLRCHNNSILVNGETGKIYNGYNGHGNITIEGGIINGNIEEFPDSFNAIGLARGTDIKIINVEFRDVTNFHAIDLTSSKNVLIENCSFLGFKDTTTNKSRYFSEAIQISEHTKDGFSAYGAFDGTPNKNVEIRNCTFGKSGTKGTTAWPVGIGNHYSIFDKYNTNINIHDNIFKGMTFAGVRNFKWRDTMIKNNTFEECNRGIALSNPNGNGESSKTSDGVQTSLPQSSENTTISGNVFKHTLQECIYGAGWEKNNTIAKIDSIHIFDNLFENQLGFYNKPIIFLSEVNNVVFSNNKISNGNRGIQLSFGSDINISGNTFMNLSKDVISIDAQNETKTSYSNNISISQNKISRFGMEALNIQNTKRFDIAENVIDTKLSNTINTIQVGNYCKDGVINNNTLITNKQSVSQIEVEDSCENIQINNNEILIE